MPPISHGTVFAAALALCGAARAAEPEIVFLAPTSSAMPFVQFSDGRLAGGILKDLGDAIALRLGRTARYVSLPGKRVEQALAAGQADVVCNVMPGWISGDFAWSRPLIPNAGIIISHRDAPIIRSLGDLAGQRVGTVLGYKYPVLEPVLGKLFQREDASTMQHALLKMEAGRNKHAIGERLELEYGMRVNKALALREDLVFETYRTSCAISRASKIPLADIEQATAGLLASGVVDVILARYR